MPRNRTKLDRTTALAISGVLVLTFGPAAVPASAFRSAALVGVTVGPGGSTGAISPTVREFRISPGHSRVDTRSGNDPVSVSGPRPVSGYGVVGVTWTGSSPAGLRFAVRTRVADGSWSAWQSLSLGTCQGRGCGDGAAAHEHGPGGDTDEFRGSRPGTDALAIGQVDEVQVRTTSPTGRLPKDLTLAVVDPGSTPHDSNASLARRSPAARSVVRTTATTIPSQPRIRTRARWGADERLRDGKPKYGQVRAGFVHHTVNANDYRRRDVPAIIRGIYAYHTQSRGWSDIGYNFLIDRFGRIWEGRYGGVRRAVIGAHTYGYNDDAFAAAAIGDFDNTKPARAVLDAYAHLMAWKLAVHGIDIPSRRSLDGDKFPAISAHRDAGSTACPGEYLYNRMRTIRVRAGRIQADA